jgi:hypothetical protein
VVLGFDDAVGGAALAGDVAVERNVSKGLFYISVWVGCGSQNRGRLEWVEDSQIDDLSLLVFHFCLGVKVKSFGRGMRGIRGSLRLAGCVCTGCVLERRRD